LQEYVGSCGGGRKKRTRGKPTIGGEVLDQKKKKYWERLRGRPGGSSSAILGSGEAGKEPKREQREKHESKSGK